MYAQRAPGESVVPFASFATSLCLHEMRCDASEGVEKKCRVRFFFIDIPRTNGDAQGLDRTILMGRESGEGRIRVECPLPPSKALILYQPLRPRFRDLRRRSLGGQE